MELTIGRGHRRAASSATILILAVSGLTACTGASPEPAQTPTPASPAAVAERREVIEVDWRDPGRRWPDVLVRHYGPGRSQPGIERIRGQEPIIPSAMSVLPGGDLVVMDPAKRRIARFDATGQVTQEFPGVSQVASDLVWDAAGDRLVWIDNESTGTVSELTLATAETHTVSMERHVARLVPTDFGVQELGSPSFDADLGYSTIPTPLRSYESAENAPLRLSDGSELVITSNRRGDRWQLERAGRWRLAVTFTGSGGPRPVVSPDDDLLLLDNLLVVGALVGSYLDDSSLGRRLILLAIDLDDGRVVRATQVRQCGLTQDANLVSRTAVDPETRTVLQFCPGRTGISVRRGWRLPQRAARPPAYDVPPASSGASAAW